MRYEEVIGSLRRSYDHNAASRETYEKTDWKIAERGVFLERLKAAKATRVIELGAGTGQDSLFFTEHGLDMTAIDLSPEMVGRCRAKGLDAAVMDFKDLLFTDSAFEGAWAMNSLLHVPNADLVDVLREIDRVLLARSLFFLGVYGGPSEEAFREDDVTDPPRFFSSRSDPEIVAFAEEVFEVVDFRPVDLGHDRYHFQALTLRSRFDRQGPKRVS